MVYVSTACVKAATIGDAVRQLAEQGYRRIELSGGTSWYSRVRADLLALREAFGLSYLCHNYFPPPSSDFVLNLSASDPALWRRSVDHLLEAVSLSRDLGAEQFGFHAGFFADLAVHELGSKAAARETAAREEAIDRFCRGYAEVSAAANGVRLYVENNALSVDHARAFGERKPFMLLDAADVAELRERLDFRLLLDVGHLKVSSQTLGLEFEPECDALLDGTDYVHVSDNDGRRDLSAGIRRDSPMARYLAGKDLRQKTITLEVYEGPMHVKQTYDLIEELTR